MLLFAKTEGTAGRMGPKAAVGECHEWIVTTSGLIDLVARNRAVFQMGSRSPLMQSERPGRTSVSVHPTVSNLLFFRPALNIKALLIL